jgi:hypothetical protein
MRQCGLRIWKYLAYTFLIDGSIVFTPPRDFGSVLQNYEAIDRFSDSIIAETNVAHNGQVHNLGQGPDVVQRYQNYLENYAEKTWNKKSSYVCNVLML